MNALRGLFLVARREYLAYVGAWGFWVSLVTTPILLSVMVFAPMLLRKAEPTRVIAVISDSAEAGADVRNAFEREERETQRAAVWTYASAALPKDSEAILAAFDNEKEIPAAIAAARAKMGEAAVRFRPPPERYRIVSPPEREASALTPYLTGQRMIDGAPLFAAFVIKGEGENTTLQYWSTNLTDTAPATRARDALSERMRLAALAKSGVSAGESARIQALEPAFDQFDPRAGPTAQAVTSADRAPFIVAIVFAFILWSAVFGVANMLLTGVLEEKSNKILDALLTSVTPLQILIGKLFGVAMVSITLFSIWGLLGGLGFSRAAMMAPEGLTADFAGAVLDPGLAITFLLCFTAGYLMYGAVFLGLGALCESIQEAQTLLGPVFLVLTGPILLLGPAFENPKSPVIEAASWIPPFTPFIMMMRAPAGLSAAEMAGPVILLIVTLIAVLIFAARVFRAGVSGRLNVTGLRQRLGFKRKQPA